MTDPLRCGLARRGDEFGGEDGPLRLMSDVLLHFHDKPHQSVPLGGLETQEFEAEGPAFDPADHGSIDFHRP